MEAFRALADEFGCWIIEDSCHSPGAFFSNSLGEAVKSGSGRYADLAIFSFHPVKHIATGEGGMITTNNEELYRKLLELRTHGITRDQDKFQNSIEMANGNQSISTHNQYPAWYMEMQSLGYNYRISDINCALGLSQLKRADSGLNRRHKIAARYHKAFKSVPQIIDRNFEANASQGETANPHAYHLYVIEVNNRLDLYNHLRENNIYAQIHYIPCHLMPYYQGLGWKFGDFPHSEDYYAGCISLPMYPILTEEEQVYVIETLLSFINRR
jgi:dTDP-4-amino-4,6-dideoxygalactose transaminase